MDFAFQLENIFSSIRQAVIGFHCGSQLITFANAAAKRVLGFDPVERPITELLPEDVFTEEYEGYVCGASIQGHRASFTISQYKEICLLTIDFIEEDIPALTLTRGMISKLRNSAMGIKMSADRCFSAVENGGVPGEKHISIFYHNYYSLLRTLVHIDNASLIERGELPFSPVPTDLVQLCSELTLRISHLFSDSGVNIQFFTSEAELTAIVDPLRIEQLLLELFSNSLRQTGSGGSIDLTLSQSGKRIILALDDTGSGIPQEQLSTIFMLPTDSGAPNLQETGLGLGLYNAFGIAQLHKGVLLIESREGEGTHVRVMLPVDEIPISKFNTHEVSYRHKGASTILTELSDVLTSESYGLRYED